MRATWCRSMKPDLCAAGALLVDTCRFCARLCPRTYVLYKGHSLVSLNDAARRNERPIRETSMRAFSLISILLATTFVGPSTEASPLIPPASGSMFTGVELHAPAAWPSCLLPMFLVAPKPSRRVTWTPLLQPTARGDHAESSGSRGVRWSGFVLQQQGDSDGALASFDDAIRVRFVEKLNWLAGQGPQQPVSTETDGRVSLTSM